MHHIRITNDMKLFVEEEIIIGERIRDLIYLENLNKILLFLENTPSLSLLEKIN